MSEMTPEEFWGILEAQKPAVHAPLEYRLYYDEDGFPLFYSVEDLPGNYIVVDQDTYLHSPTHIKVVDGKMVVYKISFAKKLVPSKYGQPCDPRDVCVVVGEDQEHIKWNLKHQEQKDE
jgi:hypothetical protein